MNARILRKWSIHTKNLMSCSVCSLVVVVLLLLVTCAPSLILATMNFRSDASFAAANPPHMPKNVIKEATLSSSSSLSSTSSSSASSASSSSTLLTSILSSLPNRKHRLASSSSAVEVVQTADINREPFPGYYKNYPADDTRQWPPQPGSSGGVGVSSSSGHNRGFLSANSRSRHAFIDNKQQLYSNNDNLGYMLPLRGWPRHHTPTPQATVDDGDDSYNDDIKPSYTDKVAGDDEYIEEDDKVAADRKVLYVRNGNGPQQIPSNLRSSYATTPNLNFPLQQPQSQQHHQQQYYNVRRMEEDRTHHVAPSPLTLHTLTTPTKTLLQLQRTSRTASTSTTAHLKQPELIHSNINKLKNVKNIFSTTHNKTLQPGGEANVFGIDNTNVNKIKTSSGLPLRFIIESYEVPASLPLARELTEQQRRMLIHEQHLKQLRTMQQQAARSRRDSLRGRYKKYENDLLTASSSTTSLSSLRKSPSPHNLRQHQHQHQHHQHQQQQRMRKHSRRYCSARDPAQLAFEAPTVFEGKIVSMTPDRRQNFSATVEVREVFKQQIGYRLQKYLRLQFAYRNNSGECDIYREQLRPRGLVRGDTIEPGRMYLLFVQQIDIGNFTILGQPIRKTKRVVEAVRYAVSGNYAQLASIKSISASNRTVENGQELRIVCKVTGRPPPKVTWFKDHRSINRNRKLYQFSHYKKRSELIIRSFNTSDAGRYECRAKNKVNRNIERRAIVIKAYPVQRFDPNPRGTGNNCPDDASEFCFNGGTCKFFSEIGSYSCICPEGFIGERCDRKEVNNMPPNFMLQSTAKYTPLII
ncbi:protein vein isoform X2 [Lucilia sericata]|uniref:protein vein isoform X2 n=1 Tax=Lucilia sericata TaxID=13632 RepID=UPI0018A87648|nr:protein vein isoform X2 [Lucilia sericata]